MPKLKELQSDSETPEEKKKIKNNSIASEEKGEQR
jgi:hypothetical protein